MIWAPLLFLFLGAVFLLILWRLSVSLETGRAAVRGAVFERDRQPRLYWMTIVLLGVAAIIVATIAALFAYDMMWGLRR